MSDITYTIALPEDLPEPVLLFLHGYLFPFQNQRILICRDFVNHGNLFELTLYASDKSLKEWRVFLPSQYILAIGEIDKESDDFGFLL